MLLLIITSAFAKPCGLEVTIEERIKDCAQVKGTFALIAVSEKGAEIYRDMKSKLILKKEDFFVLIMNLKRIRLKI